jgi:hypothetical protein
MTQTLDVHGRMSVETTRAAATPKPSAAAGQIDKWGTFAITFGIAFALLYAVFERLNWPLFTYHPAAGKLDFWMQRPRSGEGPPMYWYGWLVLTFLCTCVVSLIAIALPSRWLLRSTIFACALGVLWPAIFAGWTTLDLRSSYDTDVVASIMWMSAVPGFAGAAAAGYLIPIEWAQRLWTWLLLIVPIGALVVLAISLKTYFLR